MAWSIFTDGGGPGAALTWADELLSRIGAPLTPGNEQFVYDWELSEGGGGRYNPLNQGPVPGHPELTTTGQQYGGGAADFASVDAGLQGAADFLSMPNYRAIKADLIANNPSGARSALIASPWAKSHYAGGKNFATAPVPGQANAITGTPTGTATLTSKGDIKVGPFDTGIPGPSAWLTIIEKGGAWLLIVGGGLGLMLAGVYKIANPGVSIRQTFSDATKQAGQAASLAAVA